VGNSIPGLDAYQPTPDVFNASASVGATPQNRRYGGSSGAEPNASRVWVAATHPNDYAAPARVFVRERGIKHVI
jgi:hypothetical protein